MIAQQWEVFGDFTDAPIREIHQRRRSHRTLVCAVRHTEDGNPYVVPAVWVDSVRKCRCGDAEHYIVTSEGAEFCTGPDGMPATCNGGASSPGT